VRHGDSDENDRYELQPFSYERELGSEEHHCSASVIGAGAV
jgi:hypothetical protein